VKLIFLNRFFHPDHSATSQMLSDLAFALAERGGAVCVITSRQRYDAPADTLPLRETVDGVAVHRVWTSRFGRANLLGRAIDYATFYLSAAWRLWRLTRSGDVVIAKTDPPMLSMIAVPVCWLRGARLVNWLQDIFPEAAQALGVGGLAARAPYGLMRWLRNRSLKAAHMNVVLGERMAQRVSGLGVASDRVRIIPNWADGNAIAPIDHAANALRAEWGLGDAFVVAYSGNLGRAHEIETLLEAMTIVATAVERAILARNMPKCRPVLWLFIGSGALFDPLQAEVERLGLTSVRFKSYQPSALLAQSLPAADVHLVSLRPELEGLIVPSKFYGICAAGRPTIFVGDRNGEIARLIACHECGRTVAVGDGSGLAQTVLDLAADPALCGRMGECARQAFDAEFDKSIAIARWERLLLEVSGAAMPGSHRDAAPARDPAPSSRNAR
jgi:glycosyltransferase involved in cell wall biosynthesis